MLLPFLAWPALRGAMRVLMRLSRWAAEVRRGAGPGEQGGTASEGMEEHRLSQLAEGSTVDTPSAELNTDAHAKAGPPRASGTLLRSRGRRLGCGTHLPPSFAEHRLLSLSRRRLMNVTGVLLSPLSTWALHIQGQPVNVAPHTQWGWCRSASGSSCACCVYRSNTSGGDPLPERAPCVLVAEVVVVVMVVVVPKGVRLVVVTVVVVALVVVTVVVLPASMEGGEGMW